MLGKGDFVLVKFPFSDLSDVIRRFGKLETQQIQQLNQKLIEVVNQDLQV